MKKISLIITIFLVVSCGTTSVEYRDVAYPVYKVPESPKVERVDLPIHQLTDQDRDNWKTILPAYAVSINLLLNYSKALENIINTYNELAKQSDSLLVANNRPRMLGSSSEESNTELRTMNYIQERQQIDIEQKFKEIVSEYNKEQDNIILEYENERMESD